MKSDLIPSERKCFKVGLFEAILLWMYVYNSIFWNYILVTSTQIEIIVWFFQWFSGIYYGMVWWCNMVTFVRQCLSSKVRYWMVNYTFNTGWCYLKYKLWSFHLSCSALYSSSHESPTHQTWDPAKPMSSKLSNFTRLCHRSVSNSDKSTNNILA